jgi:hypothetical protein
VLFVAPPEAAFSAPSYTTCGVQLFRDYSRAWTNLDPWLVAGYVGDGLPALRRYEAITGGAEVDSSAVLIDRRRAWRYVQLVASLNWWQALFWRHMWGDKDTWALAAMHEQTESLESEPVAHSAGSRVGWLSALDQSGTGPPRAIWGHVQFVERIQDSSAAESWEPLYLNWQPHFAAGHIEALMRPETAPVHCCTFLDEHWEGPHAQPRLEPLMSQRVHADAIARLLNATAGALIELDPLGDGEAVLETLKPHWLHSERLRHCVICLICNGGMVGALFALGFALAAHVSFHGGVSRQSRPRLLWSLQNSHSD